MMRFMAFGEVLFDCFGSTARLGGAPLNVAAHVRRLGGACSLVSAVGDDGLGRRARKEMAALGIDASLVRTSPFPTGRSDVTVVGGNAAYVFNDPCAWDDITLPAGLPGAVDVLYYGTLAQRHATSRKTLAALLAGNVAPRRFFDVNLRGTFSSPQIVREGMRYATMVKMNGEEVAVVSRLLALDGDSIEERAASLLNAFPLDLVLVTLGAEGSVCFPRDGEAVRQECAPVRVVDTVGAGDSLSAAFLTTLLAGGTVREALERGTVLASYVCAHQGAVPAYDAELERKLGIARNA